MRKVFDAIVDIIILAMLVYTVIVTVDNTFIKYVLAVVGSGAMFNNFKYLYDVKKNKDNEPKK
jgi:hypothetical protein